MINIADFINCIEDILLVEEQIYTDCALSLHEDYNHQLWQYYDKLKGLEQMSLDCISICQNIPTEILYILGIFDKNIKLRRKIEIFQNHSKLKFDITLIQIDRWNIDDQFIIKIDGQDAQRWKFTGPISNANKKDYCGMKGDLAIQQDQLVKLSFEVDHITNIAEIEIDTILTGSGQWGVSSFFMYAVECQTGDCMKMSPLTFDLEAGVDLQSSIDKRHFVKVNFNKPVIFLNGGFEDNTNHTIWEIDRSGYTTEIQKYNTTQFIIYIQLQTTIRNNYFNITFIKPENVRSAESRNTIQNQYNKSVELPTYFYYSQSTIQSSENIAFTIEILGIGLTISLLPLIIIKQFEVIGYTYFAHQMIYYYSFSDVRMPYNIVIFFRSFKVFNFDFLPNIFKVVIPDNVQFSQIPQFNKDSLFLNNAGYLYTLLFVFFCVYLFFKLCSNPRFMRFQKIQTISEEIVKNIFEWTLFLEYIMLSFMHLLFAIFLQFKGLDFQEGICYFSFLLCLITIILLFATFFFLINYVFKNKKLIQSGDKEIERKYGVLWNSLKKESFYFQTCFNMLLILRRFLYIIITTFLHHELYVQYNIFNIFNCCIMFIIVLKKPYLQFRNNFKVFVSELQLIIIQAMIQNFRKDDGLDEDSRVRLGWFMISQIVFLIIMHYIFVAYEIIRYARYWLKKQIQEAEQQLKEKIQKASEENNKLINKNDESNNIQDQPQNLSIAIDDIIKERRRRKSSKFIELLSNRNIGDDIEKRNYSQEDVLKVKSNQNTRIRKSSINIQPFESQIRSLEQASENNLNNKLDESVDKDIVQKRQAPNEEQHMRHNRRKRGNTYISQTSIKSFKSNDEIQNNLQSITNNGYANLRKKINPNLNSENIQQLNQELAQNLSNDQNKKLNESTNSQIVQINSKNTDSQQPLQRERRRSERRKTKGIRVDSSQFDNIIQKIQDNSDNN